MEKTPVKNGDASAVLLSVIAHARAGALEHAWRIFSQSRLGERDDDPRALSVKGRLLKDFASRATGEERLAYYRQAAAAYAKAAGGGQASYPLINAATLSLLAGDVEQASALATQVVELVQAHPDEPETPYYSGATLAEALLILGREDEARRILASAIAMAPKAWEDHASTLRQFGLILEARNASAQWLTELRPPRSLHFSGHMSFHEEGGNDALHERIAELLTCEKVGFGFGALAAGADIIVAEALLSIGAEFHAILPGGAEAFAERSVDPFGPVWRRRFDVILDQAESIRPVRPENILPDQPTIDLATHVAMGLAFQHAQGLVSEAIQCLVVDPDGAQAGRGVATARAGEIWMQAGLRQHVISVPRQMPLNVAQQPEPAAGGSRAYALLAVGSRPGTDALLSPEQELFDLRAALAGMSLAFAPHWSGEYLLLAFETPRNAVLAGLELAEAGWPVGGDLTVGQIYFDPFTQNDRLAMSVVDASCGACASTLAGNFQATQDLVVVLALEAPEICITELTGELESPRSPYPLPLFSLRQRL